MILLNDLRMAIITPPKCASTTLHDACRHLPAELRAWPVLGPSLDGRIDHHTRALPAGCEDYQIVAVVRHPLGRLVSLYHHWVTWHACQGIATPAFWFMVNQIANGELGDPFYAANLTRWLDGLNIAHKVRVESLDADLKALGLEFPAKLLKANASHRVEWPDYFKQPGLLETIKPWAMPDFELGGYEWAE